MGRYKVHRGRGGNDGKNGAPLSSIRVWKWGAPDGDRAFMISPDFEGYHGQPMCLQNGPIFVS